MSLPGPSALAEAWRAIDQSSKAGGSSQRCGIPLPILEWTDAARCRHDRLHREPPDPEGGVTLDGAAKIHLDWRLTNLQSHRELVDRTTWALRRSGFPLVFTQLLPLYASLNSCRTT